MTLQEEFKNIVGQSESETLIYKTVLPPSKSIAKMIAALSNTKGGYIILGVSEAYGTINVKGLNEDFKAKTITLKGINLLTPTPITNRDYFNHSEKKLFGIKVEKSAITVLHEGKEYRMINGMISVKNSPNPPIITSIISPVIDTLNIKLHSYLSVTTEAKRKVIEHYLEALSIINDSKKLLFPDGISTISSSAKGRLLQRILFSSIADNFETYLSDLLYEIYLAKPQTLKNGQKVTIKEVLNCADMQEFIEFWAKKKISSLHKGSVKGFIEENKQINQLGVINDTIQEEVEKLLQIRHLYTHRNGIIDEKFLNHFNTATLNDEHKMSVDEFCTKLKYLSGVIEKIDTASINKYSLSVI